MKVWIVCALLCPIFMLRTTAAAAIETGPEQDQQLPVETTEQPFEELVAVENNEEPLKPEAPAKVKSVCPSGWLGYGSRCFRLMRTTQTWHNAETLCVAEKAKLVSVHSSNEYKFLQSLLDMAGISYAWIGAFNLQGSWLWIDTTRFSYTYWNTQNSVPTYPCVFMATNVGWTNTNCANKYAYVCAIEPKTC